MFWGNLRSSPGALFLLLAFRNFYHFDNPEIMYEAIAGYGLGGSSIALFGHVGGGVYTNAADVGADLSGKNDYGLEVDDHRNPACIADNVGDNVGDIAGMGADLLGSSAESACAALVLAASSPDLRQLVLADVSFADLFCGIGCRAAHPPLTEGCVPGEGNE